MITRRYLLRATAALAPALSPRIARAQGAAANWPNRFVRLIVPFPPGGGTDAVGRILTARLSEVWGQQVIIENRGGAGSNIGNEAAARSDPDGYTILFATIALAINRFMYKSLPYNPDTDFAPITVLANYPNVMAVPNSSSAKSVQEFVALAKAKPGMTFGSSGVGTTPHLSGELFKRMAGIEMTHVPYRGAGPAINDLIPGRLDMMFNTIGAMLTQVRNGQVRGLAVTSPQRFFTAPDLPTVAESGVPGFDVVGWYGLAAPAKAPPEIVRKINTDVVAVLNEPAVKKRLEDLGVGVVGSTPEEMAALIRAETAKWEPIIKAAGISPG
ncbi:MAG TPA: tripartite tricarboxylate transporter substrate binding protein [Xanthobacteraceae bacterium]|nr:tripartite tricarboxylate transporter substrate binding protein [Xanthobacteraceae bacterium]